MAEEDVESLRHVYAEWERGNFTPRFELYAPDWEWGWSEEFPGLGGVKPAAREAGYAHLWTFRDGRAVRLEIFSSRDRALGAAGAGR